MFENKLGCCPRTTVFVLDRSSRFLSLSKQHIDLDGSSKGKSSKSLGKSSSLGPVYKNAWTCSIESTVEYCRIVYDLFPNEYIVSIAEFIGTICCTCKLIFQELSRFFYI